MTFVDTSALVALLDADDRRHDDARRIFRRLEDERDELLTSSYVVHE